MGTKHTEGQWQYAPLQREHGEGLVFTGNDPENADAHIAVVSGGLGYVMEGGRCFESEANAALIAAAPDLLAACKNLLDCIVSHGELGGAYATFSGDDIRKALAAIDRAEGVEQ